MISIVIVSHSAKLAEGVRDLAEQMVHGQVPLAIAGGIDDPENPIGTDAMRVYTAIESVYSLDGVLVLMDLGSALLSAEMALEFLSPEQRANVYSLFGPWMWGVTKPCRILIWGVKLIHFWGGGAFAFAWISPTSSKHNCGPFCEPAPATISS